ncbi:MAG TPA: dipeptidase [Pyrinomonadaceae bacterium]|jgi:acetylornithine deacetylase/succinyl-diaminopimelate desuccinylase-like protein
MNKPGAKSASASPAYVRANAARFVEELKQFVSFPSVSAQPKHADDLKKCAAWLAAHLHGIGLEHVRIVETPRHPIVYADWLHAPSRPTLLVYGHYDVQPADPLDEWQTPPFEPTVRGQYIYGRGACDDKGQLFAHLKALEFYLLRVGRLPVNVRCLFEGEEEIGSPNLKSFLSQHKRALRSDAAVMSDTRMLAADRPALTYALRGGLSFELEVEGAPSDLHSGNFGGALHNPLQALCEIVAALHDRHGRVTVPGFYERVRVWNEGERAYMAEHGPSDEKILRDAGARRGWGERGFSLYERTTVRPALTVNGIGGGYQGTGGKSIIPSRAFAKINIRLVPDQDPHDIERLVRAHIARLTPPTVRSNVRTHLRSRPALIDRTHPAMRAAAASYRAGFGASPVFVRSGGSIPVVNIFQELLQLQTVLMGFALPDDRIHAPNERFYLPNLFRGIITCAHFLSAIAAKPGLRAVTGVARQAQRNV